MNAEARMCLWLGICGEAMPAAFVTGSNAQRNLDSQFCTAPTRPHMPTICVEAMSTVSDCCKTALDQFSLPRACANATAQANYEGRDCDRAVELMNA